MAIESKTVQESVSAVGSTYQRIGDDVVAGNVYDKYHTHNLFARFLMERFERAFVKMFQLQPGENMLEIGCGEGYLMSQIHTRFPSTKMTGLDVSFNIVKVANRVGCPDVSFLQASAYELPWEDESWDVVVACEVLEHLKNPERALAEMRRVCRKGCLVSVPREPFWRMANMARLRYVCRLGNTPGHIQHWGRREFIDLVGSFFFVKVVENPFPWTMIWGDK